MRLVRHLCDLPHEQLGAGSVVTIGAFDGLHLGHRQLLDRVIKEAKRSATPAIVMSFEPTPKVFFFGAQIFNKIDMNVLAIDISVKVKQMHFEKRFRQIECRASTDAGHAIYDALSKP